MPWIALLLACAASPDPEEPARPPPTAPTFTLEVPDAREGQLPLESTCHGEGLSPAIQWAQLPEGTHSVALATILLAAPTTITWLVWNAPAEAGGIEARLLPTAPHPRQGLTEANQVGWATLCPKAGNPPLELVFAAWALPGTLDLPPSRPPREVIDELVARRIGQAELHLQVTAP